MTTIPSTSTVGTGASSVPNAIDNTEIASNFTTFLQLLTTQLKNQNPLDPLDTNQFTQQLVEFAQVEQQMKSNDQLASLVSLEKSAAATTGSRTSAPRSWLTARPRS
jgi:flagellar basal-body rod modification protein FlgD